MPPRGITAPVTGTTRVGGPRIYNKNEDTPDYLLYKIHQLRHHLKNWNNTPRDIHERIALFIHKLSGDIHPPNANAKLIRSMQGLKLNLESDLRKVIQNHLESHIENYLIRVRDLRVTD